MAPRKKRVTRSSNKKVDVAASPSKALPDEIVKEILIHTPGVVIPHEHFINTDRRSPFQDPTHVSSSTILIVCKQWLRVATPLVYHTVILRSRAQALALERALNEKEENKILGPYIKWIRLEGHYGNIMADILAVSPNITDLCFTLTPWASENPYGMMDVFDQLNPVTLILYDSQSFSRDRKPGVRTVQLWEALQEQIPKWTSLKHVHLLTSDYNRDLAFCKALSMTPNLQTVYLDGTYRPNYDVLAQNPTLEKIHVYALHTFFKPPPSDRLRSLLIFGGKTIEEIEAEETEAEQGFSIPINASEIFDDEIWKRIIEFCMVDTTGYIAHKRETHDPSPSPRILPSFTPDRFQVLLTCKTFYRLAFNSYHEVVVLQSAKQLLTFATYLISRPQLIKYIKRIIFDMGQYTRDACSEKGPVVEMFRQTRLTSLFDDGLLHPEYDSYSSTFLCMPWKMFQVVCDSSSTTLQDLRLLRVTGAPEDGSSFLPPFMNLNSLRTLCWYSNGQITLDPSQVDPHTLPSLEELNYEDAVQNRVAGCSFLAALTCMKLSSLRKVSFSVRRTSEDSKSDVDPFLRAHGKKILSLRTNSLSTMQSPFKSCPNMTEFSARIGERMDETTFKCFFLLEVGKHRSLTKLQFELPYQDRWCTARYAPSSSLEFIYDPTAYRSFPNLKEIHMPQNCVWPTSEREIQSSGNTWPLRAESLLEKNIKLTNWAGKHWTPRLRVVK